MKTATGLAVAPFPRPHTPAPLLRKRLQRRRQRREIRDGVCGRFFGRNKDLVDKFLAIAESKVSIIDEYGDENWEALPDENKVCLKKIATREQLSFDWKLFDPQIARQLRQGLDDDDQYVEDKRAPGPIADAVTSLVNLGYDQSQAMAAVTAAVRDAGAGADTARLIRLGLKELARDLTR
jgi:hypothetical protein